jgi:ATP-dependent helicase/nuclease subunit A
MTAAQMRAADPAHSAWVGASAGTGKTKVLTDRVLRLMLAGTKPEAVLCLTFTRAAAAEMAVRLNDVLADWATEDEAKLGKALTDLTGETPDGARIDAARRLFARVLEAPGGIRIQTIHAFCQSLLARFPLEAGVPPHFEVLAERESRELLAGIVAELLGRARAGDEALDAALATIAGELQEQAFDDLLSIIVRERARLRALIRDHGGLDRTIVAVADALGLPPGATEEEILAEGCRDMAFDRTGLIAAAEAFASGSDNDIRKGAAIGDFVAAPERDRPALLADYRKAFLTKEGTVLARLATNAVKGALPSIEDTLVREAERLIALEERRKAVRVAAATGALLVFADALFDSYDRRKGARARLDYDDLIQGALGLLRSPGAAPWVLYKLDGGIDHILVDEAQDTNPSQWEIVRILAEEFFAGEGVRAGGRTVFAVGDAKQSIFSFQGADPEGFADMRGYFAERIAAAEAGFETVALDRSFRSTDAVLDAVDLVFALDPARDGVVEPGERVRHVADRVGQAGKVEVWPLIGPREADDPGPWALPTAPRPGDAPAARLARVIADRIADWIEAKKPGEEGWLDSRDRAMAPGDVMVLVRRRTAFVEELVRALKDRDVAVAGVDRMILTNQLAVQDLVALGRFLLLPEDDLTLASVLKGPFIGLDEDALFRLAHGRSGTLWAALRAAASADPVVAAARDKLEVLLAGVDFERPYELYAGLLAGGGRRALLGRLGPDAAEPVDEFLALALEHERGEAPGLEGFLHWLVAGETEIKRELEQGGDAVRIMTVHGAKGLQAPVVILPDTTTKPIRDDALLWPGDLVLWPPKRAAEETVCRAARAEARAAREREYRRLLYVAMTRAEDRLYVCGWHGKTAPPADCWYELIRAGLNEHAEAVHIDLSQDSADGWAGHGLRFARTQRGATKTDDRAGLIRLAPPPLPPWTGRPPPPEPSPPRPLAPSRPGEEEPPVFSPLAGGDEARFRRGLVVHALLQHLPELAPDRRAAACAAYLARPLLDLEPDTQAALGREVLAVLDAPEFAALFAPDSRAEAPLAGKIGDAVISGQVDRLAVTDEAVLIVDYKTNRPPPVAVEAVSPLYLRQMASYRALLRRIYPDRAVRCALLWTDGPRLMSLPDVLLDPWIP